MIEVGSSNYVDKDQVVAIAYDKDSVTGQYVTHVYLRTGAHLKLQGLSSSTVAERLGFTINKSTGYSDPQQRGFSFY